MFAMPIKGELLHKWSGLALISAIFLFATGGAFSSLGVLLPSMMEEFGWSWTKGGAGFTVLGLATGLSSTFPAHIIKKFNVRTSYAVGAVFLCAGFGGLAISSGFLSYLAAASLIGIGYSLAGTVPAITALSDWFDTRRSQAIGVYFTSGAVGSILGPLGASFFIQSIDSWRLYWVMISVMTLGLCILAALTIPKTNQTNPDQGEQDAEQDKQSGAASAGEQSASLTQADWSLAQVLRSPQYYIIVFGLTVTLLGALTMNAWQVTHMQNMGVATQIAAGALSAHAIFNALSRAVGGVIIDRIGAKWIMASGLFAGVIGMAALSKADTPLLIALYAIGDGYSFGIVTFASAILLLNYYGAKNNAAILGVMNLISTLAMVGPILAGRIGEQVSGFSVVFLGLAFMIMAAFILVVLMPAPELRKTAQ